MWKQDVSILANVQAYPTRSLAMAAPRGRAALPHVLSQRLIIVLISGAAQRRNDSIASNSLEQLLARLGGFQETAASTMVDSGMLGGGNRRCSRTRRHRWH